MSFTVQELNEWYENLESDTGSSPEHKLKGDDTPFGKLEWAVDEGLDPDDRGAYYIVCKFGDRYFKIDGAYDSWQGTDWYGGEEWEEVEQAERVEKYWKTI